MVPGKTMVRVDCVINTKDQLGETPLWCVRSQSVWWIDIEKPTLHRFAPETGAHDAFPITGNFLGSLAFRSNGDLLIAIDASLYTHAPGKGEPVLFRQVEPPDLDTRLNDGRVDARGRFWVGSMDNRLSRPVGSFYGVNPDGTVRQWFGDIIVTNTVAIAPDQKTLYVSDTRRFTIWAFDLDVDDGILSNRRVFADFTATRERPDGACVDTDGCLWNALFAGHRVVRYAPDGRIDRSIDLPVTNPTCVCFGGSDLRTLYVTSARKFLTDAQLADEPLAGALFALMPGAQGLPEWSFGGQPER